MGRENWETQDFRSLCQVQSWQDLGSKARPVGHPQWREEGHRSLCCCCSAPQGCKCTAARKWEFAPLPPMLPDSLGLQTQPYGHRSRITGTTSDVLVLPSLGILVHPTFNIQMYRFPQQPGVLNRSTFAELWMFYWLQIERETRVCSCRHDVDIPPSSIILSSLIEV